MRASIIIVGSMKLIAFFIFVFSMSVHARPAALKCKSGDEATVKLVEQPDMSYHAEVMVQAGPENFPTYRFQNIQLQVYPRRVGSPAVYEGADIEFKVYVGPQLRGVLEIPALNISGLEFSCK